MAGESHIQTDTQELALGSLKFNSKDLLRIGLSISTVNGSSKQANTWNPVKVFL
jgi:hypothetical protein